MAETAFERGCWCGSSELLTYSAEYLRCGRCDSLVSQLGLTPVEAKVQNDNSDFYGKGYWLSHQNDDLRLPCIEERARLDLLGLGVHWLRTLLSCKLPPGRVLELGCAHGGFVALMRWAGFDAVGLELSPWVVEFARRTFHVPVLLGPLEDQRLEASSFDAIVLNDVLEHLPDPCATIGRCAELLRPDGVLVVQTPGFPARSYQELRTEQAAFLEMMSPKVAREHIYLFSSKSARLLLARYGLTALRFEPTPCSFNMYFVAGRALGRAHDSQAMRRALAATPSGRLIDAFLQLDATQQQLRMVHHAALRRLAEVEDLGPTSLRVTHGLKRVAGHVPGLLRIGRRLLRPAA